MADAPRFTARYAPIAREVGARVRPDRLVQFGTRSQTHRLSAAEARELAAQLVAAAEAAERATGEGDGDGGQGHQRRPDGR